LQYIFNELFHRLLEFLRVRRNQAARGQQSQLDFDIAQNGGLEPGRHLGDAMVQVKSATVEFLSPGESLEFLGQFDATMGGAYHIADQPGILATFIQIGFQQGKVAGDGSEDIVQLMCKTAASCTSASSFSVSGMGSRRRVGPYTS